LSSYQPEEARDIRCGGTEEKKGRTVTLHDGQELDDDLGGGADQDLALASLLGVVDSIQAVVEDGGLDHFGGGRFSMAVERLRYLCGLVVSLQMPEHGECP
jgi:hypothetical protein